jgi:plasmid stabilization system protein ParE
MPLAPRAARKKAVPSGTAKFREETSKKTDTAVRDRVAAMHKVGQHRCSCKAYPVPAAGRLVTEALLAHGRARFSERTAPPPLASGLPVGQALSRIKLHGCAQDARTRQCPAHSVAEETGSLRQRSALRPRAGRSSMPRGDKSAYTDKQKRQAEHIEEGYEHRGVSKNEAERRAWATVNKETGGGKKSGSGRGLPEDHAPSRKGGRLGGQSSSARPKAARSASAKKAAATRKGNAAHRASG